MSEILKVKETRTTIGVGQLFIGGEWVEVNPKDYFDVINPATEEVITQVAQAGQVEVDLAVKNARGALEGDWGKLTGRQRAKYLFKIAELLTKYKEKFAELETLNNGKPISETMNADLPLAIQCFEQYASYAMNIKGETLPVDGNFHNYTRKEPVGVVAQIIPWNFPLLMLAWKLGPALASGCTVVLKPAEQTPLTALLFAEILVEAGLPAGAVNNHYRRWSYWCILSCT